MSDDLKDRARFVVQLFRECNAIHLPHKPTEEVLLGMIDRIEELEGERRKTFQALLRVTKIHDEVEAELHLMKTSGIVEVAVRNPSVMEYMKHWEGRAEAAEVKLAKAVAFLDDLWDSGDYFADDLNDLRKELKGEDRG